MVKQTYRIDKGKPLGEVIKVCQKAVDNGDFVPDYDSKQNDKYEILGVKRFKEQLLRHDDQPHYHLEGGSLKDLEDYMVKSKEFESHHITTGVTGLGLATLILFAEIPLPLKLAVAGGMTLVNLGYNGYPIMLQKYNQKRLSKVIEKMKARGASIQRYYGVLLPD